MNPPPKPFYRMVLALLAGTVLGSAASAAIYPGTFYGGNCWNYFVSALVLSPVGMSIGLLISVFELPPLLCFLPFAGALTSAASLFMGVWKCYPRPQWVMFAGAILWNLGNTTAIQVMMGI